MNPYLVNRRNQMITSLFVHQKFKSISLVFVKIIFYMIKTFAFVNAHVLQTWQLLPFSKTTDYNSIKKRNEVEMQDVIHMSKRFDQIFCPKETQKRDDLRFQKFVGKNDGIEVEMYRLILSASFIYKKTMTTCSNFDFSIRLLHYILY